MDPWALLPALVIATVAVVALTVRPGSRIHQILAALLLLRAGVVAANTALLGAAEATLAHAAAAAQVWYALALPALTLWLAVELFAQRPRGHRAWLAAAAGLTLTAGIAWLAAPELFVENVPPRAIGHGYNVTSGPLYYALNAVAVLADATLVVFAYALARREERPVARQHALALAWAFGIATLYAGGYFVSRSLVDPAALRDGLYALRAAPTILAGSAVALALGALSRKTGALASRATDAGILALFALGVLDGYAGSNPAILARLPGYESSQGLVRLAFTALVLIAVTRYGLASAGVRTRARAASVLQLALAAALALAGAFAALSFFGPNAIGALGVGLALVLPALLWPTMRPPARFLLRALLLPPSDPRAVAERARTYASAVAAARAPDGRLLPEGEELLAQMRADLGISEQEHALLVSGVASREEERYRSLETLGRGSTAQVELAVDEVAGRRVVVKRFKGLRDPGAVLREARALAAVRHPRVIPFLEVDRRGDDVYLVLAYAERGSARQLLDREGPLPAERALGLALDLIEGLEALHAAGIVHGDVKPENLLVGADGRGMLGDFGSARFHTPDLADATLTGAGAEGSLSTVSPEALRGAPPAPARDVYAAGALLYRLLTGEHYVPLGGATVFEARERILLDAPRLPHARVPAALEPVLRKALAKRPEERHASAREMREALLRAAARAAA